jgi:hypothetical protein
LAGTGSRLYEAYASQHAGTGGGEAAALIYRRDIRTLLPPPAAGSCPPVAHGLVSAARVVVWQLVSAGYRITLAAETSVLRGHIVTQNLTFAARGAAES